MGGQREPVVFDFDSGVLGYLRRGGGFTPLGTDMLVPVVFGASGTDHAPGLVPDPGSASGSTRYLCEDGTWSVPSGGGGSSDHATLTHLSWVDSGHVATGGVVHLAAFDTGNAAVLYTVSGSGTVVALATSASLTTPTMVSYVAWTDTSAAAGAAGRLQRNGAELSWHNGTAATNLEQVGRKDANSGYAGLDGSGLLKTAEFPAFTGDVTTASGGVATTIGAHKVTRGMEAQGGACSVVGVTGNATADVADIAASTNDTIFGRFSNALGFRTVIAWLGVLLTTAGNMITFDGTNVIQSAMVNPGFGNGADGDVTYSGNTTLAAPVNAHNITINSSVRVSAAGFLIRATGTLTFTDATSIISNNGGNSTGVGIGSAAPNAMLGGGSDGGAGRNLVTNTGNASSSRTNSWPFSTSATNTGKGGDGGTDGNGHAGGTGTTPGSVSTNSKSFGFTSYDFGSTAGTGALTNLTGGSGGGGGGCTNTSSSGGGGGGGGVNIVWAYIVTGAGIVESSGGNGGNASGTQAGGGGGGGGGAAVLVTHLTQGSAPTVRAVGGTHGNGAGSGANGSDGANGYAETRTIA
jgi:hypothetical protein